MLQEESNTEQKIISAAKEIFVIKGLQGARMQEIADKAGINKALLHYYFRSKDKLFDAVFQESIEELFPLLSSQFDTSGNFENSINNIVAFYNNYLKENPFIPQFFFHEIWQHPEKVATFIKQKTDVIEKVTEITNAMDIGNTEAQYKSQHLVANILGMCFFPFISRPIFQRIFFNNNEEKYDKFLSERTEVLTDIINNFLKPDKTK